jgi:hypothetical protein
MSMFICPCREKNGGFFDLLALSFLNFHFWSKPKIPEHDIPSATIFALLASKWKLRNNCWEMTKNAPFSIFYSLKNKRKRKRKRNSSPRIFALLASKWKLINNCWEMTNNSPFSFIHKKELKKN